MGLDQALRQRGVILHFLPETHEDVSATQIRAAMGKRIGLTELVPDMVAEYIRKEGLYRDTPSPKPKRKPAKKSTRVKKSTRSRSA